MVGECSFCFLVRERNHAWFFASATTFHCKSVVIENEQWGCFERYYCRMRLVYPRQYWMRDLTTAICSETRSLGYLTKLCLAAHLYYSNVYLLLLLSPLQLVATVVVQSSNLLAVDMGTV
jgi:hypothetical protein